MFYLNLSSSWNWVSCGESWKSLLPIFLIFHRTDFGGFLVCCYKAIQQLNGVEKNFVAISLMLNHNLTGLIIVIILLGLVSKNHQNSAIRLNSWYSFLILETLNTYRYSFGSCYPTKAPRWNESTFPGLSGALRRRSGLRMTVEKIYLCGVSSDICLTCKITLHMTVN